MAGSGRLAADVEDVGALGGHPPRLLDGACNGVARPPGKQAVAAERVGRDVDDAHHERPDAPGEGSSADDRWRGWRLGNARLGVMRQGYGGCRVHRAWLPHSDRAVGHEPGAHVADKVQRAAHDQRPAAGRGSLERGVDGAVRVGDGRRARRPTRRRARRVQRVRASLGRGWRTGRRAAERRREGRACPPASDWPRLPIRTVGGPSVSCGSRSASASARAATPAGLWAPSSSMSGRPSGLSSSIRPGQRALAKPWRSAGRWQWRCRRARAPRRSPARPPRWPPGAGPAARLLMVAAVRHRRLVSRRGPCRSTSSGATTLERHTRRAMRGVGSRPAPARSRR